MKRFAFFLFLMFCIDLANAEIVTISGNADEYKNTDFVLYTYSDLITRCDYELAKVHIDPNGDFSCQFNLEQTSEIYTYLGVYKAFMYAEPNRSYEIVLPPRVDKNMGQQVSLVFEPELISLGVKNADENDLNYLIQEFNGIYESFLEDNFTMLYISGKKQPVDSIIEVLDKRFANAKNDYFNVYRKYRCAMLKHFVYERDRNVATRKYLLNQPFYYKNVAYMDFVQNVWRGYFANETSNTDEMYEAVIYGKSPKIVKDLLEKNIALRNDTLKELVMLQGLHEALLEHNKFPYRPLFQTLDSINLTTSVAEHRVLSQNIKTRHTFVHEGEEAPDFALANVQKDTITLSSFRGKYVYLQFCRSENFECLKDYRMIETFYDKFADDLEVVTISYDLNYNTFVDFIKSNPQYGWQFLFATDNKELLQVYNIKALPTYMLVDDSGILLKSPEASPHENFTYIFTQMLNWKQRVKEIESQKASE